MSTVDVIVPCYRYGHFLRECVESVLSQSDVDVRVLIIDDASPDNTPEVAAELVRKDPRVTYSRHLINKGHIATYNEGIEWASSDYMLILSADDYLLPDALKRAAELLDSQSGVGFTFGNVIERCDGGIETPVSCISGFTDSSRKPILQGLAFIELCGADNLVRACTAVVRTKLQKRLGGYRHELPHAGDMEMWLRFAAHAPVGVIDAYQGVYRRHNANMSTAYYYYTTDGHLVYTSNGRLADLQQRSSALACFFQACADILPDYEHLHRKLHWQLSKTALEHASAAFNEGDLEASEGLSEFALAVCAHTKRSLGWMKLTCKRCMGPSIWRALRPAAAVIRAVQRI